MDNHYPLKPVSDIPNTLSGLQEPTVPPPHPTEVLDETFQPSRFSTPGGAITTNQPFVIGDGYFDENLNCICRPALGLSWSHCVTMRIAMGQMNIQPTNTNDDRDRSARPDSVRATDEPPNSRGTRTLLVQKSPVIKTPQALPYFIQDSGIVFAVE